MKIEYVTHPPAAGTAMRTGELLVSTWEVDTRPPIFRVTMQFDGFLPNSLYSVCMTQQSLRTLLKDPLMESIRTFLGSLPTDIPMRDLEKRINTLAARFENPYL